VLDVAADVAVAVAVGVALVLLLSPSLAANYSN